MNSTKTLNVHFTKVDIILDPQLMPDAFSMMVNGQIFRGLFKYNVRGDAVPDLAESWTVSPDKKVYVFKLKKSTFSNGKPIEACDVQMTFARMFSSGASMSADLNYIEGTEKFQKTKNIKDLGVKVLSPTEVAFHLSYPSTLFLSHLAVVDCSVLSLNDFNEDVKITKEFGFSGPYKVTKVTPELITIEKWRKDEADSANPPQIINFQITEKDPVVLVDSGLTDSLDHETLSPEKAEELVKKGWNAFPTEVVGEFFMVINPKFVPEDVRRWFYFRTNTKDVVSKLPGGTFKAAYGLIPTGVPGELIESDVSSISKSALKEPSGHFEIEYEKNNKFQEGVVKTLQEAWQTSKLKIDLKPLPRKEKFDRLFDKTAVVSITEKGLDYPDGYSIVTYFKSGVKANYFHVEDPQVDKDITKAAKEVDTGKRIQIYKDIQMDVLKHFTVIPLFFGSSASGLWSPKVKSVPAHPMGFHTLPFETVEMN